MALCTHGPEAPELPAVIAPPKFGRHSRDLVVFQVQITEA